MKKQETYWAPLKGRKIRHLFRKFTNVPYTWSACGLIAPNHAPSRKGKKCKSCLRVIKD